MPNYHPPANEKVTYRKIIWAEQGCAMIEKCPLEKLDGVECMALSCSSCASFRGYRDDDGNRRDLIQRFVGPWWNRCGTVLCGLEKAVLPGRVSKKQGEKAKKKNAELAKGKKKGKDAATGEPDGKAAEASGGSGKQS